MLAKKSLLSLRRVKLEALERRLRESAQRDVGRMLGDIAYATYDIALR